MKPRLQLMLVFSLLAAAIVYNVWVFTRPSRSPSAASSGLPLLGSPQPGPSVTGDAEVEVSDPTTLPPVPDVGLDRPPDWPRNPFINARLRVVETPAAATAVDAEADLVLASILHSPERRLAIVNGRIVEVGDRIGAVIVRRIDPRAVVVEEPGGATRTLELRVALRSVER
jgi:hypothetical protein